MKSLRFQIMLAQPEDNKGICGLIRIPFAGDISLAMEREPDYFLGARIQYEQPETYVCRDRSNNRMAACFSVGKRNVFLNGRKTSLRYHSDLRIDPDYQKTFVLFDICSYFKEHIVLLEGFSQTIVFSDNHIMNALIHLKGRERLRSVVPFYIPHGRYITHTVSLRKRRNPKSSLYHIRQARKEDVSMMQDFFDQEAGSKQFYPCYDFSKVQSDYYHGLMVQDYFLAFEGEQLVGLTGIWDQQCFKQTRVAGYSNRLKILKPWINALGFLRSGFLLPDEGEKLNYVTLHTIVVKNNSSDILAGLCESIYARYREQNYQYMLCGLDEQDPLNEVFRKGYEERKLVGTHYLVSYDEECLNKLNPALFYLEAARI